MKKIAGLFAATVFAVACGQTDSGITTAVKSRMAVDPTVKAYQIDVETHDKVVTLRGEVASSAAETMAIRIARDTDGVRDVIDEIGVVQLVPTTGIEVDVDEGFKQDVKDAGTATRDAAEKVGDAVVDGAKKGATAVKDGARKVGGAVKDAVTNDDRD